MRPLLIALTALLVAAAADATTLYATTTGLVGPMGLYSVNTSTGATTFIDDAGGWFWEDISGRPGDTTHIYGVARTVTEDQTNVVSTIDVTTGEVVDLFDFTPVELGFASDATLFLTGISISIANPSIATISAFGLEASSSARTVIFDLDLLTGSFTSPQTLATHVQDLTRGHDGTPLLGVASVPTPGSVVATVEPSTGIVNLFGGPNLNHQSLEYNVDTNELLIAPDSGQLVRISATTGAVLGSIGPTGLGNGVLGLAFVGGPLPIPEPGTGALLALGLLGYGLASKGRGGSRTSSRRA